METKTETIRSQALTLGLSNTRSQLDTLLHTAEQRDMTHMEFLEYLLNEEIRCRLDKGTPAAGGMLSLRKTPERL